MSRTSRMGNGFQVLWESLGKLMLENSGWNPVLFRKVHFWSVKSLLFEWQRDLTSGAHFKKEK